MTGDPLSGGRIDLVTNEVGMAFGRPFCRDGSGVIYFMSNRGSIYKMAPGSLPERISDPIDQLLLTINFDQYLVCSAWDERSYGAHFWISPVIQGPTSHYFFDAHSGAWWQDQYQNSHNPFAALEWEDGDPNQRYVLIGGNDGYIRRLDVLAGDDDGVGITSNCLFGPIKDKNGAGMYVSDVQCDLDTASVGPVVGGPVINWSLLTGSNAQAAINGQVNGSGSFSAGRNRSQALRTFGHALFLNLVGLGVPGASWSLEYIRARLAIPEGKARERIF